MIKIPSMADNCRPHIRHQMAVLGRALKNSSLWCVKNSYLIHPLSENSNFLCKMLLFFVLNMCTKNKIKNSTSRSLFLTCTWKKLRFCKVRSKNQNKLILSWNARNFTNTSYLCKNTSSVAFRISLELF